MRGMSKEEARVNAVAGPGMGGVHGWGCTPTGDPPAAALTHNDDTQPSCVSNMLRGWRRTTLYGILVFLMIIVFLNIALTLWIISALKLSMNGIGPLKIVNGGIQLDGQAWVTDSLVTSTITSRPAQPVTIHSHRNFTVLVSKPNHLEHAKLLLKRDRLQCSAHTFEVLDARGGGVFHASRDQVRVHVAALAVEGAGGVTARGGLQAPLVHAPPGADLQLESLTRGLNLKAPQSIYLESRAGGIEITSHSNIHLNSIVGALKIDASSIEINNLKEAVLTESPNRNVRGPKVYQLCACASGKLFLASGDGLCVANDDDLCR